MALKANYLTVDEDIRSEFRTVDSKTRDYVLDALGNVVEVFQGTSVVADASYKPYGAMVSGSWNMASYKFRWAGSLGYRYTGLDWVTAYVRARHYSYNDGSWTSVDPLWPRQPAYRYVGGRVTRAVDPSGRTVKTIGPVDPGYSKDIPTCCNRINGVIGTVQFFDYMVSCMSDLDLTIPQMSASNRESRLKRLIQAELDNLGTVCGSNIDGRHNVCVADSTQPGSPVTNECMKSACTTNKSIGFALASTVSPFGDDILNRFPLNDSGCTSVSPLDKCGSLKGDNTDCNCVVVLCNTDYYKSLAVHCTALFHEITHCGGPDHGDKTKDNDIIYGFGCCLGKYFFGDETNSNCWPFSKKK